MTDIPQIAICMVTYKRTDLALRTVRSVSENLKYPNRQWYIADDGSEWSHVEQILDALKTSNETVYGWHNEKMGDGVNAGGGWNRAVIKGHEISPIILWLEDDWELRKPLEITPYVKLLVEKTDVGLVRLGTLAVGNDVSIVGYDGIHYLEYLRGKQYCYSGNPLLRHVRFAMTYGMFAEDRNPGEIELAMDTEFHRVNDGEKIWRPAAIDPWGAFSHIGTEKSW